MNDRLTAEPGTLEFLIACARADYLSHPGTINYFDRDGNLVIAPNTPKYRAEKCMWEARLFGGGG